MKPWTECREPGHFREVLVLRDALRALVEVLQPAAKLPTQAHTVDIVYRSDARERYYEGDWLKHVPEPLAWAEELLNE